MHMQRLMSTAYRGRSGKKDRLNAGFRALRESKRAAREETVRTTNADRNPPNVFSGNTTSGGATAQKSGSERVILRRQESIGSRNLGPLAFVHVCGAFLFSAAIMVRDRIPGLGVSRNELQQAKEANEEYENVEETQPCQDKEPVGDLAAKESEAHAVAAPIQSPSPAMRSATALAAISVAMVVSVYAIRTTHRRLIEIRLIGLERVRVYRRSLFGSPGLTLIRELSPKQLAVDFAKLRAAVMARYSLPSKKNWLSRRENDSSLTSTDGGPRIDTTIKLQLRPPNAPAVEYKLDIRDLSTVNVHAIESVAIDIGKETESVPVTSP